MKQTIFCLALLLASVAAYADSMTRYLKHSSGLVLSVNDNGTAVINTATSSSKKMNFQQQADGSFYITISDNGTPRYLTLGTANGWSTYFQTECHTTRSRYTIEQADGRYIRLKNASTGKYLGTDAVTNGSPVYSDKSGTDATHRWYLADKYNEALPPDTLSYVIAPAQRLQTTEGWGLSLCWWAAQCGNWSDAKLDQLITWLVSPSGLNMNIFRYNIGGGDDPQNAHCDLHHMDKGKGRRAEMEGFQDEPGGVYHWERDAAQRRVMLKIKEKRPDAIFEAFSNSAPWWMTYSGCCAGAVKANEDNLKPEYYEAFAHYLVDVCKHYKETYGIEFRTLDPFNEAMTDYWYANGSQEGCHFDIQSQINFLKVLAPVLEESGLKTVISASDETSVATAVDVLKAMQADGIAEKVGQWNTHTYQASNRARSQFGSLARATGKRVWMSEVGSGGSGLSGNLSLARKMFDDLHYIQPDAWIDWQYVEENNDQWCLVNAKFNDASSAQRVKNYYVRSQVTRFIPAGYTFVQTLSNNAIAAVSPDTTKLVIALLNQQANKAVHRIRLPFTQVDGTVRFYHTTSSSNVVRTTGHTKMEGDSVLVVSLDALSIATIEVPIRLESPDASLYEGDTFLIVPQSNLETAIDTKSQKLVLGTLNPDLPTQRWTLSNRDADGFFRFTNGKSEIISYRTTSYPIEVRTRAMSTYRQQFLIDSIPGFCYRIMYGDSAFDLQGNALTAGTTVGMYGYGKSFDADTRNWRFVRLSTLPENIDAVVARPMAPMSAQICRPDGIRTDNPNKGVNIIREGSKTKKILY